MKETKLSTKQKKEDKKMKTLNIDATKEIIDFLNRSDVNTFQKKDTCGSCQGCACYSSQPEKSRMTLVFKNGNTYIISDGGTCYKPFVAVYNADFHVKNDLKKDESILEILSSYKEISEEDVKKVFRNEFRCDEEFHELFELEF